MTDAKLAEIKAACVLNAVEGNEQAKDILAVIRRLKAAERLTDFASCKCESLDQCKCGCLKSYVRWKKSCNK